MGRPVLILNLGAGLFGVLVIILKHLESTGSNPASLTQDILILTLVIAVINIIVQLFNYFKPPPATKQDVEQLFTEYMGEKPKNPPIEEVKSEIEKEFKTAFEKKEKRALKLYKKGNEAYNKNQFIEAISYFKSALEIVETASIHLSLGNSCIVISDYEAALENHNLALGLYRDSENRKGEGTQLCNLGIAYRNLGQYEKAIEFHEQSLTINREIKDRKGEGTILGNLGNVYYSLDQYEKAKKFYKEALIILEEIKSPHAEIVRKNLNKLKQIEKEQTNMSLRLWKCVTRRIYLKRQSPIEVKRIEKVYLLLHNSLYMNIILV